MITNEIIFVAKIHKQGGFAFYLPKKLVSWLGITFSTYNNQVYIKLSKDAEEVRVDCTATRYRETWKFSFYPWYAKGIKPGVEYLFRVPFKPR